MAFHKFPMTSTTKQLVIKEKQLVREDSLFFNLEGFTDVEEEFFKIEDSFFYGRTDSFHTRYQVEFSLDGDVT